MPPDCLCLGLTASVRRERAGAERRRERQQGRRRLIANLDVRGADILGFSSHVRQ